RQRGEQETSVFRRLDPCDGWGGLSGHARRVPGMPTTPEPDAATVPAPAGGAPSATASLRERAEAVLRELVADPAARLREDQWTAIESLVAGRRRALVVQRTGWGKSAVYFVATALLRSGAAGPPSGPTVIVSPLLALMRNQVGAAARAGIVAETINSANVT